MADNSETIVDNSLATPKTVEWKRRENTRPLLPAHSSLQRLALRLRGGTTMSTIAPGSTFRTFVSPLSPGQLS